MRHEFIKQQKVVWRYCVDELPELVRRAFEKHCGACETCSEEVDVCRSLVSETCENLAVPQGGV